MAEEALNAIVALEALAIVILAPFAVREAFYMRRLVKATLERFSDLWLIRLLSRASGRLTAASVYFSVLVIVGLFLGRESAVNLRPISGWVLIWLLTTVIVIGHELRRRKGPGA